MPDAVELVRKHIEAVASFSWDALDASMATDAILTFEGVADWKWEVGNLYRNITQAWDFAISEAVLRDAGNGGVTGMIVLSNATWRKEVACEYRVASDLISSIAFSESKPINTVSG